MYCPAAIIEFACGVFGKEFATGEFLRALHELDAPYDMQTYKQGNCAGVGKLLGTMQKP